MVNCKHRKVVVAPAGKNARFDVACSWCKRVVLANATEKDVAGYLLQSNSHLMEGGNYLSFYDGPAIPSLVIEQKEHLMEYALKIERFPVTEKEAELLLNYCGEGTDFSYCVENDVLIRVDNGDFAEQNYDLSMLIDDLVRNNYELLEYANEQLEDGEELPEGYLEGLIEDEPFVDSLAARFYNA